jgi:beta-galactosidase
MSATFNPSMPKGAIKNMPTTLPGLHFGAAYYPEHWPEERWPEDIRLMKEANLTVVRMAEFAWSTLEPEQGVYQFEWLDRAIQLLADAGIQSVLGTPTAAPPAWLMEKVPDMYAVDETGKRVQFGNRCHYCPTSPDYHAAVQQLVGAMAEHFGPNPNIIGWQLDNEYNRICTCDNCRKEFQAFLQARYATLENLNQRWSTAYWSQTYSRWEQIPIPIGGHNPGLMLEFKRFVTASYQKFQKLQIDLLRPQLKPEVWITHNFMGWFGGFDHYEMAQDLDLASWDWYVGTGHHQYKKTGAIHDLTRGFKRKNFWVMETQPANVNWSRINNVLNKGEGRVMAWHAVAHGADAFLYWQWRSALNGQEQYHGSLVDQSGQPRPFYEEARQIGAEFAKYGSLLAGSTVKARVAMLNTYDGRWSIEMQRHHADFDYVEHFNNYYRALTANNIPVDIISPDEPFHGYRLVIAPALVLLNEQRVANLKEYVRGGGHLVLTLRTGMKDEFNSLIPARQPGWLTELAGVEVEEYYALDEPAPVKGNWFEGQSIQWAERLRVLTQSKAAIIARYGPANGWLDDQIAITVSAFGASGGLVYYVGAYLDEAAQQAMIDRFLKNAAVTTIPAPDGVEIRHRLTPDEKQLYIIINHTRAEQTVSLPWPVYDCVKETDVTGQFTLEPYGVTLATRG